MEEGGGEAIQVFLRLKPSKRPSPFIKLAAGAKDDDDDADQEQPRQLPQRLAFDLPAPDAASVGGVVNNNKTHHPFTFNGIFEMDATQGDLFDRVGREVVQSALNGYNATIFAYGQTGSGKTFTITGGPARYEDRGLLPRALAMVFEEMRRGKGEMQYQVYASYLEVYNEVGYDLLDGSFSASETKGAAAAGVGSLPRVTLLEDEEGNCHLRNLSMHLVGSEEEALNLLFLGDTNRAISATAMNQTSSRSHCIFTLSLEGRRRGAGAEDRVRRSKLNLCDLAGSERVHKTVARGQTLREARYINQSLFYLEMVILALHEKRAHVPYRNSMMTSVLRDSLGGNCHTVMVATISTERAHTAESISTCRFAQRVAQVWNDARCNEEVDPYQVIQRLKNELSTARAEVGYLRGEAGEGAPLGEAEQRAVAAACQEFVARGRRRSLSQKGEPSPPEEDAPPALGKLTLSRVYHAFRVLRAMVLAAKVEAGAGAAVAAVESEQSAGRGPAVALTPPSHFVAAAPIPPPALEGARAAGARAAPSPPSQSTPASRRRPPSSTGSIPTPADPAVLHDRSAAMAHFMACHPRAAELEEGKRLLKAKYAEAKRLGEQVVQSRASVTELRQTVEQLQRWREDKASDAAALLLDAGHEEEMALVAEEEGKMLRELEEARGAYQEAYARLRALKGEVEGAQRLVEQGRQRVQAEFEAWLASASASAPAASERAGDEEEEVTGSCGAPTRRVSASAPSLSLSAARGSRSASTTERKVGERGPGSLSASSSSLSSSSSSVGLGQSQGQGRGGRGDVDDDIAAFYRAKEELLALRRQREGGAGAW